MSLHDLVGRELALVLNNPAFAIRSTFDYRNSAGRLGLRLVGSVGNTPFHIAQSHTTAPPSLALLERILTDPNCLDCSKSIIYDAGRRLGRGIRIEAWYLGRWYHVFVPLFRGIRQHESIARVLMLINMWN
jgi:hypothetical protein